MLENSIGRLIINMNARNSICPGKIKANPKLRLDMLDVISKLMKIIIISWYAFRENLKKFKLQAIIKKFCIIVMNIINNVAEMIIVFLDINGDTSNLFKKPNSLSKIKVSPEFNAPVKDVKIIIPQLRNGPYSLFILNKFKGTF